MDRILESTHAQLAAGAVASACAVLIAWSWARKRSHSKLPPGPPLHPIIGGLRTMPSEHQWLTFSQWSKKWGDVISTSLFGAPVVILNSIDSARDLLDKKGAIYSDRPRAIVYNELIGWDTVISMPYGDRFRKHRRLMSQVLNSQAVGQYVDVQHNQVKELLKGLLSHPEKFEHHILRQAYTTLIRVTYGLNVVSDDDVLVSMFGETLNRVVDEGAPGACMIDMFPLLKHVPSWLPGAGYQKRLKTTGGFVENMKTVPFERVRAERRAGTARSSLVGRLLDDYEISGHVDLEHEYDIKLVGAAMYAAGVETTATTMATFFQMMAKHPEVVKRAHEEIDAVTHRERLPTLDDRKSLPIIDCIMKEVFRINAPVPLCVPHSSVEEDIYRDMRIPAGATMIPNIWQMMRDERYFTEPDKFNPERFRKRAEKLEGNSLIVLNGLDRDDPSAMVFGFGRRICPGRYFVDNGLWLMMSNILGVFDIGPPIDAYGRPQQVGEIKFTSGITSRPIPFECTIQPRDALSSKVILDTDVDYDL